MNHIEVEYIGSGAFQGSEQDCDKARIGFGETCIVIRKRDYDALVRKSPSKGPKMLKPITRKRKDPLDFLSKGAPPQ